MTRKCKLGFVSKNILRNLQLHFKTVVMFRRNFRHFLVGFALFFANSITVWVAQVASATQTVILFAKNSAQTTRKVTQIAPKIYYSVEKLQLVV